MRIENSEKWKKILFLLTVFFLGIQPIWSQRIDSDDANSKMGSKQNTKGSQVTIPQYSISAGYSLYPVVLIEGFISDRITLGVGSGFGGQIRGSYFITPPLKQKIGAKLSTAISYVEYNIYSDDLIIEPAIGFYYVGKRNTAYELNYIQTVKITNSSSRPFVGAKVAYTFDLDSHKKNAGTRDSSLIFSRNAINATAALTTQTISVERRLALFDSSFFKTIAIRTGFGRLEVPLGTTGYEANLGFSGITGLNNKHFEFYLGARMAYDRIEYSNNRELPNRFLKSTWVAPSFSAGYKYEKPSGGLIFRTGVGLPQVVYVGLGAAF